MHPVEWLNHPLARWGAGLALVLVYAAAAELGLALAFPDTNVSPVWPPTGIALAALYLGGLRFWPAVFAGAFGINYVFLAQALLPWSTALAGAAGIALGNTLEAVVGAYLLQRLVHGDCPFMNLRGLLAFLLAGVLACAISATLGVTSTRLAGITGGASYPALWLTWWVGDTGGAIVVAPFLIACRYAEWHRPSAARLSEGAALLLTLLLSCALVFGPGAELAKGYAATGFALIPVLLWAALRFYLPGVTGAVLLIALLAVAGTVQGRGPFAGANINEALMLLQSFVAVLASAGLTLAAALNERLRLARELAASNAELKQLAFYDSLTGLANRRLFKDRLEQTVNAGERSGVSAALLFLDLDNFKTVNDSLGHDSGDRLLQEVAARLQACVRQEDSVSRLGGDEFVVLLRSVDGQDGANGASRVARKLIQALREPVLINGHAVTPTTSIGITLTPQDGRDSLALMKNADLALYRAKEHGRNTFRFFTEEMQRAASERLQLEEELRLALARGELCLHYQPIVRLADGRPYALEALLRWQHPARGLLPPRAFLPVAESTELIGALGRWVLSEASREFAALQQGDAGLKLAVNLSLRQFRDPELPDCLAETLRRVGLDRLWLHVELAEEALPGRSEELLTPLKRLAGLNIGLSIDHYGSAVSSLSLLKRLPVELIKLDQSLIAALPGDQAAVELVDAVLTMAHRLKLEVVAEGVESEGQLALLRRLGCDYAQGFHISRPLTATNLPAYLAA